MYTCQNQHTQKKEPNFFTLLFFSCVCHFTWEKPRKTNEKTKDEEITCESQPNCVNVFWVCDFIFSAMYGRW